MIPFLIYAFFLLNLNILWVAAYGSSDYRPCCYELKLKLRVSYFLGLLLYGCSFTKEITSIKSG